MSQEKSATVSFTNLSQEESLIEPFVIACSLPLDESRFTFSESYLAEIVETMRQRQMLDLDGRNSGQADNTSFTDIIWEDEELFGDEWMDFSVQEEKGDFWNEIFEDDLLLLK